MVFDVETTQLIEEDTAPEDMEVAVACAMRLPHDATAARAKAEAVTRTFWHETVRRAPRGGEAESVETLLEWMDDARIVVAYNGRAFDMRVMERWYKGDEERRRAHLAKLHDPMIEAQRVIGRRVKLSTLLSLNGLGGKTGVGCDAPRWWQEGRHAQLERYCERDVEALAELVLRDRVRVDRHTFTERLALATVTGALAAEEEGGGRRKRTDGGATEGAPSATRQRREGEGRAQKRPATYDETARRTRRAAGGAYMEKGHRRGAKRHAIEMGAAAIERVVRGAYEWRDSAFAAVRGERKRHWDDAG